MRAVGFRAEKDKVHWAIVEGDSQNPILIAHDKFSAPRTYDDAEKFAWFRQRVLTLIEEHQPDAAAVRFGETFLAQKPKPNALSSMFTRARIEGVVIEAASSARLPVLTGTLVTLSAKLGAKRAKGYLEARELRGIDLSKAPENRREAILAAAAALGFEKGE